MLYLSMNLTMQVPCVNVLVVSCLVCLADWFCTSFRRQVVRVTKYGGLNGVNTVSIWIIIGNRIYKYEINITNIVQSGYTGCHLF